MPITVPLAVPSGGTAVGTYNCVHTGTSLIRNEFFLDTNSRYYLGSDGDPRGGGRFV